MTQNRFPASFTTEALRDFFRHLSQSHSCFPLGDWEDGRNGVLLRQDVDLDLLQARNFANIQAEEGLRSTFFVLLTSDCYNALSRESRAILRSLVRDGFEIGLHFDPTVDDDRKRYLKEAEQLSLVAGEEIRSISLHNPTSRGEFPLFPDFLNAYDPRIFHPDRYLSDSCQSWKHDPWQFVKKSGECIIQLLFHPCHYSLDGRGYRDAFKSYLDRHLDLVDSSFRPYNANFRQQVFPHLKDSYLRLCETFPLDPSKAAHPE